MRWLGLLVAAQMSAPVGAIAAEALEAREFLGGKLSMLVPASFKVMSDEMRRSKYSGDKPPTLVLTDKSNSTDITFHHTPAKMTLEALPEFGSALRQAYPDAKFHSSGSRTINGSEFFKIDLETQSPDGRVRSVVAITAMQGRLLLVSYNCLVSREPKCWHLGHQLIESIKLKGQ